MGNKFFQVLRNGVLSASLFLIACAHPISITPLSTPKQTAPLSAKKVAYLISEDDKNRLITSAGGGGDKITYYPYRDLEKSVRDALMSIYSDVTAIKTMSDDLVKSGSVSLVFTPLITTVSSSDSMVTWPPTHFFIDISCTVSNSAGGIVDKFQVSSDGYAEYSDFKQDFGLAGRRAASEVSEKLRQTIVNNSKLK